MEGDIFGARERSEAFKLGGASWQTHWRWAGKWEALCDVIDREISGLILEVMLFWPFGSAD